MQPVDEIPVAGKATYDIPQEEVPEDTNPEASGPLEKRLESKVWKTRTQALEELANLLRTDSDPPFSAYLNYLVKYVSDSHPGAQEKGLEVLSVYIEHQPDMVASQTDQISKAIVEKGLASAKTTIKQQAQTILLDLFGINKNSEAFIEGLKSALGNRNVKIQAAALYAINTLMNAYGIMKVPFKPFVDVVEKYAGASNPTVRGEALNFYKEAYRWVRELIKPNVEKLKKPQQDELEKAFAEITEPPVPTRTVKGEEEVKEQQGSQPKAPKIDIYAMAEARDIFSKFGEKWVDKLLAMEKWQEKKQALEEINTEADYPKLAEKSPLHLVTLCKRLLNDNNMQVMLQVIKLSGLLAKGQRSYYSNHAKHLFPLILQKFKDKKAPVVAQAHSSLENLLFATSIETVLDDIKAAMEDKTPSVKINTFLFLEKIFADMEPDKVERVLREISSILKKGMEDSTVEVRNTALKLVSSLMSKCPEIAESLTKDLPEAKKKKLNETNAPPKRNRSQEKKKEEEKKQPQRKDVKSKTQPTKPEPKAKPQPKQAKAEEDTGPAISAEDAENAVACIIPNETLEKLKASPWKDRQAGLLELLEWISENSQQVSENSEAMFRFVRSVTNDWKENNFNVIKAAIGVLSSICENCNVTKRGGAMALTAQALEKLGDPKIVEPLSALLMSLCEVLGPRFVVAMTVKNTSECKKPKAVSECCNVVNKIISEFGVHTVNLPDVVNYSKACLNQANPTIKKSAQALLVCIYSFTGEPLISMLNDVKEATMKVLNEEFSKTEVVQKTSFKQVRGEEEEKIDPSKAMDSAIPRNDISSKITPALIKKISDKNWKVRKEALDEIESILNAAGMRIQTTGSEKIFKALKERMNDPNKSLVRQSLSLTGKMAEALGSDCSKFTKSMVPKLISNLADKQSLLRQDALAAIDKWSQEAGPESIINQTATPLTQENPELRTELLNWLLAHKENLPKCDLKPMVQGILGCLQDRSSGIRNAAELLFAEVIDQVGFESLEPFLKDIKPAVMNSLRSVIDKYRGTGEPEETKEPPLSARGTRKTTQPANRSNSNSKNRPQTAQIKTDGGKSPKVKSTKASPAAPDISIINTGNKEKRLEYDLRCKWNPEELRQDYVDRLKDQFRQLVTNDLASLMFASDFKKQMEAASHIGNLMKTQYDEFLDILDMIFKWIWVKLMELSNTQLTKSVLELSQNILNLLQENDYFLSDGEANMLLPVMCEKSGQNNSVFRSMIRQIILTSSKVYPPEKVFTYNLQALNSKNTRSKTECLEAMSCLIQEYGISISQPRDIRSVAKFVNSSDNNVRSAAVGTVTEAYKYVQDKIWTMIGDVPDKSKGLLEQRFKTVGGVGSEKKKESTSRISTPRNVGLKINFEEEKEEPIKPGFNLKLPEMPKPQAKEETKQVEKTPEPQRPQILTPPPKSEEKKIPVLETLYTSPDVGNNESLLYEPLKFEEPFSDIDKHIETLRSGDMSSRVDALVAINDLILNNLETHKKELQKKANSLVEALIKVINSTFNRPPEEIPLRFAKYFLNVVHKVCCTKIVMRELTDQSLFELCEQILNRLLIENLDKLGEKGEGEIMLKTLNGTMLRILEHCHPTKIFLNLIKLLTKYKGDSSIPKMPGLIIRCLLKLTKVLSNVIEEIDIPQLLLAMHEYLTHNRSSYSSDEMGTKTIKTILNELVKLKGESIWESFEMVRKHPSQDNHLEKWIGMILSNSSQSLNASISSPKLSKSPTERFLNQTFTKLSNQESYNEGINELYNHIEQNPKTDLTPYISTVGSELYYNITEDLKKMRQKEETEDKGNFGSYNFQEFQNRLAMMKQRYGLVSSNTPTQLSTTLNDLKSKVNSLLNRTQNEEQSEFLADMKTRIQSLNKKE